jgi:hypothetical protein
MWQNTGQPDRSQIAIQYGECAVHDAYRHTLIIFAPLTSELNPKRASVWRYTLLVFCVLESLGMYR